MTALKKAIENTGYFLAGLVGLAALAVWAYVALLAVRWLVRWIIY